MTTLVLFEYAVSQKKTTVIYGVTLNWLQNDDQDFVAAMQFDHVIIFNFWIDFAW